MRNINYIKSILLCALVSVITSAVIAVISPLCGIISFVGFCVAIIIFTVYTNERYKDLARLNDYLTSVCSGEYDLDLPDNCEGEISILKNNLYKVVVMLKTRSEALLKEREHLADSMADISHQLKTPLTSMLVLIDLIKNENDTSKEQEFISIIESQLDKMTWLISTLLKFSKLDSHTVEFNKSETDIKTLIDSALKPFLITLDLKNIEVVKKINTFNVFCDKAWTLEAIQNVIKNCIEHTPDGGVIKIQSSDTNVYSQLIISDNGCGIDEKDLGHIFERFYHGENSSNDSVGIGLALTKEILLKQNSSIEVVSDGEGCGSSFIIKFYKSIV